MSDEEIPRKQWKGTWIPKSIWEHPTISWMEKCLLAEIDNLDDGSGCFASNEYLAEKFNSTPASIANMLSRLKAARLTFLRGFDGRRRRLSCRHSSDDKVRAALTEWLSLNEPGDKPCINSAVNAQIPLIIDERKEERKVEKYSSAKASSPAASAGTKEDNCPYQQIVEDYHQLCPTMPKLRGTSPKRQRLIREQWQLSRRAHPSAPLKQLCELFEMAEKSDLLTGRDIPNREGEHKNWRASFDWLMDANNAVKVLEGKYVNRDKSPRLPCAQNNFPRNGEPAKPSPGQSALERYGANYTKLNLK